MTRGEIYAMRREQQWLRTSIIIIKVKLIHNVHM
jgi:hypothetical protein